MFERYTERARRVLFFARYEASQLGSLSIEPEHLLLGLLREGQGLTARLFARAHITLESIRQQIEHQSTFREKVSTSVEIPFSPSTMSVLQLAAEEADRLLNNYIGTEHLLLAILRDGTSPAAAILRNKGMHLETSRDVIVQILNETPTADAPAGEEVQFGQYVPRASWGRSLPHYLPSRTVHITYSALSPREDAWVLRAGQTWRAFGYTLRQIVAVAWSTHESLVRIAVPQLDENTRYNLAIVLPHTESLDIVPQLVQEAIERDFNVEVVREDDELPAFVVKAR